MLTRFRGVLTAKSPDKAATCAACPLRARCTTSSNGRSVSIHPDEKLLAELAGYHHLPSVRGDLLARLGRYAEAAAEFGRAASLTKIIPARTVLVQRAADCAAGNAAYVVMRAGDSAHPATERPGIE